MQDLNSIKKLVQGVKFNDWHYHVRTSNGVPYLQIKFMALDSFNLDAKPSLQSCRKWMLSYHMCDEEIVSTAFKATMAAVEHEAREQFFWEGQAIYRPHYSIRALHALSEKNAVEKRDEPSKAVEAPENVLSPMGMG